MIRVKFEPDGTVALWPEEPVTFDFPDEYQPSLVAVQGDVVRLKGKTGGRGLPLRLKVESVDDCIMARVTTMPVGVSPAAFVADLGTLTIPRSIWEESFEAVAPGAELTMELEELIALAVPSDGSPHNSG